MAKARATSSRKRHKDPYPYVGTPDGDQIIGTCDGRWCGRELRRGDAWVTTLSGHLVCRSCWHKPMEEWLPADTSNFNPMPEDVDVEGFTEACAKIPDDVDFSPFADEPRWETPPGGRPERRSPMTDAELVEEFGPDNPYF